MNGHLSASTPRKGVILPNTLNDILYGKPSSLTRFVRGVLGLKPVIFECV